MSALTQADADYIIRKAEYIALFTRRAVELGCASQQERADKEASLLSTFVTGIAIVKESHDVAA